MDGNDDITWEQIYADIDTILNGGRLENQEESRRRARIIRLKWDPDESADECEVDSGPGEIPVQPIPSASGRDRRHLFR